MGRKTAAALIREFGGLESLLANIDKVKSARTREKLINARDQILENRKMVDLDCDLELPVPIDELRIEPDYPNLIRTLEQCEFKSLLQEVRDEAARIGSDAQRNLCNDQMRRTVRFGNSPEFRLTNAQTRIFRKKLERAPLQTVKLNRLRRFGWLHVFLYSLFLLSVRCPNLFLSDI